MSNAVYFNSYKLKKGSSIPDFQHAVDELFKEIGAKNKGYISFTLFNDGDTWADYSVWETMEDLNAFIASANAAGERGTNELAQKFYSFLNFSTCKSNQFNVKINR
jgi:heme-degrading monooxygenase HmoA